MKKALALVLALAMVFSMGTMAFAANEYVCGYCDSAYGTADELDDHIKDQHASSTKDPITCPICGGKFYIESEYNKHIEICDVKANGSETIMADFSIKEILNMIVELAKSSMGQWDAIESVIIELIGFVEKITELGINAVSKAEVNGAVAELESALADIEIPGISDLLNGLKQKIKDLYAGEVATTVEETTAAEESSDTGSSSVGIALFAAVSVAAAAAYVCTKKSK